MAELFDSPFRRLHRASARLERLSIGRARHVHRPVLYGRRMVAAPGMALAVRKKLGVNRHVLNQMVVAGTVRFMPAFPPPSRRTEAPPTEPPVQPKTVTPASAGAPPVPAAASGEFPPGVLPPTAMRTELPTTIQTSSISEE